MIELSKNKYPIVLKHLQQVNFNYLFAKSVIKDKIDGKVFVDNEKIPTSFYVLHSYGMSLLFGNEKNESFNSSLKNYLLNINNKRKKIEWLQVFPNIWHYQLEKILGNDLIRKEMQDQFISERTDKRVIENTRVNFTFDQLKYEEFKRNIDLSRYQIVSTTKDLYNKMDGEVVPKAFWKSAEHFEESGIGYSLIRDGQLASTAYSAFIHGNQLELGIETVTGFKGKSLAAICCSALIDYCIANKFEPVWSCRLENIASYQLAQKLGFEPVASRPYYLVKI